MNKSKSIAVIKRLTDNVAEKVVDAVLVGIYLNMEFPKYGRTKRWKIQQVMDEDMAELNYQTIKRAFVQLKRNGFIQTIKDSSALPKITEMGKKKVASFLPIYDNERIWDGKIYLITYDLPVVNNNKRNYLRNYLKQIGCGMLQKSVWITPYNPTILLEEYAIKKGLTDLILVSSLGKGGTIGSMEIPDLVKKVYPLREINQRYFELITNYKNNHLSNDAFIFSYLSILKDDPQLPFELLPETWLGEKANKIYKQFSGQA